MGRHKMTAEYQFSKMSKENQIKEIKSLLILHKDIYKRDTAIIEGIDKGLEKIQNTIMLLEEIIKNEDIERFKKEYLSNPKRL